MRWIAVLTAVLFQSCSGGAVLYVDDVFQAASPETVSAWKQLAPFRDARTEVLPSPALKSLQARLDKSGLPALVAVSLTGAEQASLEAAYPRTRILFLTGGAKPLHIGVNRLEAWTLVAARAAAPGPAAVLYPSDVTAEEAAGFEKAWRQAGGGTLASGTGLQPQLLAGQTQVFLWGGPETDSAAASLPPAVAVHGNPGTARAAGASGLTWKVRSSGLGEMLWNSLHDSAPGPYFLPLETVLEHR